MVAARCVCSARACALDIFEQLGRAAPPPPELIVDPEAAWPEAIDGLPVVFPKGGYQGAYIGEIAARLRERHGESLLDEPGDGAFRSAAQSAIFDEIRGTLDALASYSTSISTRHRSTRTEKSRRRWQRCANAGSYTNPTVQRGCVRPNSASIVTACW